MSEEIRSFIAVEIENGEVLKRIIKFKNMISELSGVSLKPVEDENIHITIRFLGSIDRTTLDMVKKIIDKLASLKRFNIHIKGVGGFPSISRPRVLWVGIEEGFENLREIRGYIDLNLRGLRVHEDQHEFLPHITIARVKDSIPQKAVQTLISYASEDFGFSEVSKIYLKKSTLTPRGPIYSNIHFVELS
ncbi:MAG: RNA 2',3'-cyclic phosphodiesterase [Sulfolobales archaeon]